MTGPHVFLQAGLIFANLWANLTWSRRCPTVLVFHVTGHCVLVDELEAHHALQLVSIWGHQVLRLQHVKALFAENVHRPKTLFDHHLEWRWLKDAMSLSQVILHTSFVLKQSTTRFYCASHRRASLVLVLNVSFYRALMDRLHAVRALLMGCRKA